MREMQAAERVVIVPPLAAGERLDAFLQHHGGERELSRSEWQRLIGLDAVRLNGQPSKSGHRLTSGDLIQIVHVTRELNLPSCATTRASCARVSSIVSTKTPRAFWSSDARWPPRPRCNARCKAARPKSAIWCWSAATSARKKG